MAATEAQSVVASSSTTPMASPPHPSTSTQPVVPSTSSAPPAVPAAFESPIQPHPAANNASSPPLNPNLPVCANCRTQTTPLWRRAENGTTLCNACSLYQKMKGTPRPVSLKTDVIKHRNRSKGENARKATKAAIAAATAAHGAAGQQPEDYRGGSQSRGTSHSRTREGLGQKSGPGGADGDVDADYWDDEGGDYKRARHGFYGYAHSPTRQPRAISRGRGSRSSSQQRRSDSSESRSEGHTGGVAHPHLVPYPIYYFPPPPPGQAQHMPPYAYPYPPPPHEWAAYMQQMHAQGMPPGMPPYMMPYSGPPHMGPPGAQLNGHGSENNTLPPIRAQAGSRSQSVDSFAREAERGRSSIPHPYQPAAPLGPSNGSDTVRTASAASAIPPQFYHPYMRSGPQHTRPAPAVSDARLTPPRDGRARRASDTLPRPNSSASSSGGSQEGRFHKASSPTITISASRAPDAMTIDEVDEMPDGELDGGEPAHGPVRGGAAHERRGRSSTRKPASGMPHDVDERLEKMRMESPLLAPTQMRPIASVLPPDTLSPAATPVPPPLQAGAATKSDEPVDELTALRLRVSELEFINGILQTRISELEKGSKQV